MPYQPRSRPAARIESFEKKPANGGMPTSASEPIRKTTLVNVISFPIPASLRMSCSPTSEWIGSQAERDDVRDRAAGRRGGEDAGVVEVTRLLDQQEERERHRRVAERVHHERLLRGGDRRRAVLVVADQQVAREADHSPAREQEQQ